MQTGLLPFDVTPSWLLPWPFKSMIRPIEPALLRHFMPDALCRGYLASDPVGGSAVQFTGDMLRHLGIGYHVTPSDLERIPATGPCVIMANHPYGLLEGFILVTLLEKIRPDYRIVANTLLASTPALHEPVIFVNPFEEAGVHENGRSLRASLKCLRNGGLLVMFPAGEVAHFNWSERSVTDPAGTRRSPVAPEKSAVRRFLSSLRALIAFPFRCWAPFTRGCVRSTWPANWSRKKRKRIIEVRIGTPIAASILNSFPNAEAATD